MPFRVTITASTHVGLVRTGNEDAVGVGEWFSNGALWRPRRISLILDRPLLCVIADGMGGHPAGEVASEIAVRSLADSSERMTDEENVVLALERANGTLFRRMAEDPLTRDMGTTVVGLLLRPDRLLWFNVGDSRLYQHRGGFLRQVSSDDVARPAGESDFASGDLLQVLGGPGHRHPLAPHVGSDGPPLAASRWLLCSDGLWGMLRRSELEAAMRGDDLQAWLDLFAGAMEAGAHDNVSIVLVTIEPDLAPGGGNG